MYCYRNSLSSCILCCFQYTYTLAWTKEDGILPYWAEDDGLGVLTIRNVHAEDAGTYTCIGSNAYSIDNDKAVLIVSCEY